MNEQLDRIEIKLAELEGKVDATLESSEKMRKYFKLTMYITLGAILIPLVLIPLILPGFLASQGVGLSGF